jgi:hypothetical protein
MRKIAWMSLLALLVVPALGAQSHENVGAPEGPAVPAGPPGPIWEAPSAVLWDNGPLVTHPGGGSGGANASALQTALGLNTFGFGHALTSGFRVADDFTVTDPTGWQVTTVTFFAYQTGSTTTSTLDHMNLRIWNGSPGAPGSAIVFGDTTTNRLASSAFTNAYRVTDTALTGNTRPIMTVVATVNTTLPAGTYWLDWQVGGTLASGPWAPPVSILGQTAPAGANGRQYDPVAATWNPALDTGTAQVQQAFPFVVEGDPVPAPSVLEIPTLGMAGLAALALLLGAASLLFLRRRAA